MPATTTAEPIAPGPVATCQRAAPRRALRAGIALAVLGPIVAQFLLVATGHERLPVGWDAVAAIASATSFAGALVMLLALLTISLGSPRPSGRVVVASEGLMYRANSGRTRRVPRDRIRAGVMVPSGGGFRVDLTTRDGDRVIAWVASAAEGEALLNTAGVGAAQQRLRQSLGARSNGVIGGFAAGVLSLALTTYAASSLGETLGTTANFAVWAAVNVGFVTLLLRMFRPPEITVGADGVGIRMSFWKWFVSIDALSDANSTPNGYLTLRLRDGRTRSYYASVHPEIVTSVALRIRAAIAARAGHTGHAEPLVALERGGRELADWRTELRGLARSAAGYRDAHFERADVLRALRDPATPALRRLGAALALTEASDPDGAASIRVAADACANEPMRVALERVLDGSLDASTVERLEVAERTRQTPR